LQAALGNFFVGPILDGSSPRNVEKRLAAEIRSMASEWQPRAEPDPATGKEVPIRLPWLKLERRLAKEAWLSKEAPSPPWQLGEGPGIVTFFSFKGGVGRSTALASCAWQLARKGQRVAVVDLDLEGPGAGTLLGSTPDRGVIDFFADWMATGRRGSVADLKSAASGLGSDAEEERIDVYPAGRLGMPYLEKLARLDFVAASAAEDGSSPIESGLRALLGKIRSESNPDYILLDARSGLHDLAGLSLHGASHVDVVFTRASEQGFAGLEVTLETLGRTRQPEELQLVIVHAMAPAQRDEAYEREKERVLNESHALFGEFIYGDDPPAIDTPDSAHTPCVLQSDEALERFEKLVHVEDRLLGSDYRALLERIELLCKKDEE
jgi:MinD-like ATPase involved in chromosome partitioning or flagellar assembly